MDDLSQELEKKHKVAKVPGHYLNQPETATQSNKSEAGQLKHPHEQIPPSEANATDHNHTETDIKDCYCSSELKKGYNNPSA